MENIALVAVDLDGTLLTGTGDAAPEGCRLLREAGRNGVHVVIATTRSPVFVQPLCRSLELHDPIICSNGAQAWASPDGPVWAEHMIPLETALAIAHLADANDWELCATVNMKTYFRQRPGQALGQIAPNRVVVATNIEQISSAPSRFLIFQPETIRGIRAVFQQFADQCSMETYYNPDGSEESLGIFARGVNKGTALALVLEQLGIGEEQVMAIGDNNADLPMFAHAGIRVAMGNAREEIKRQATVVAPSNDEEGVAWALRMYHVGEAGNPR